MKCENCDICGEKLSERQLEILEEISEHNIPCYCDVVRRIDDLEETINNLNKVVEVMKNDSKENS